MRTNKKISKTLEKARNMGQREDTVLAHINPMEAEELRRKYGGDINPHTGLPQYGKFWKKIVRIAAPILGHVVAGPVGAAIGGGLGRGATSRGNFGNNFMRGAAPALAISGLGSIAGGGMNIPFLQGGQGFMGMQGPQDGFMGKVFGRGPGSVTGGLNNFGANMFPGSAPNGPNQQDMQNVPPGYAAGDQQQNSPGFIQQLISSIGGPVPAALTAASLLALSKKKDKIIQPPAQTYHNPFPGESGPSKRAKPLRRRIKTPRELEHEVDGNSGVFFDDVNPETEHYAQGGPVRGHGGGTADNIKTGVKDNTFIWDATDVSLLGDGNTENGFHKLNEFEKRLLSSKYVPKNRPPSKGEVQIRISNGEYRMDPLAVAALGHMRGGDINTGIQAIKDMRKNLKAQKGFSGKKIPPKAKLIMNYMRG